jgi:archaellum component FlaC
LGLPELNKKVNELVTQIRVLYDKINTVRSQIPPEEARITGYLR